MATSLAPQAIASDFTAYSRPIPVVTPIADDTVARSPVSSDILAIELARLIEGQRQFAEEFGLPYERVFTDGFESFKGRDTSFVIHDWLSGVDSGTAKLARLFNDLVSHQLALIGAIETIVSHAAKGEMQLNAAGRVKYSIWARLSAVLPRRRRARTASSDPTLSYLCLVAPAFVAAYARLREDLRAQQQ